MFEYFMVTMGVWSLSRFIRKENGPACFMPRLKAWLCKKYCCQNGECAPWKKYCVEGEPEEGTISEWLSCNKCLSFGLAIPTFILWVCLDPHRYPPMVWVVMPFAIRGGSILIDYLDEITGYHAKRSKLLQKDLGKCDAVTTPDNS